MMRIAICDDDITALSIISGALKSLLSQYEILAEIEVFSKTSALKKRMKETTFELLLLDIEMPQMDGIAFGELLRQQKNQVDLIYISNREDQIFQALRNHPEGFIRKSCFMEDTRHVLQHYLEKYREDSRPCITIESRTGLQTVFTEDLIYIEGEAKYQNLYLKDRIEPIQIRRSMGDLEKELIPHGFLRVHKGYLVNYRFIRLIQEKELLLTDGKTIPVSRRKLQETKARYLELMQKKGSILLRK